MKDHWEKIFSTKNPNEMSWTQTGASKSLELIKESGVGPTSHLIDIGSGESVLIPELVKRGFTDLTVLDIASAAIARAKEKLEKGGERIHWMVSDVLTADLESGSFHLWHDRAVFHFLTQKNQREAYVAKLKRSLRPGGFVVIGTFGLSGPEKCSGLEIVRYSADMLSSELGPEFKLLRSSDEVHTTPWGSSQSFLYCLFKRERT